MKHCGFWKNGSYYFENAPGKGGIGPESEMRDIWEFACDELTPTDTSGYDDFCEGRMEYTLVPCGLENCAEEEYDPETFEAYLPGDECYSPMYDKYTDANNNRMCRSMVCMDEDVPAWYDYGGTFVPSDFLRDGRLDNYFSMARKTHEFVRSLRGKDGIIAVPEDICRIWDAADYMALTNSRSERLNVTSGIDTIRPTNERFPIPQSSDYLFGAVKDRREQRQQWWANQEGVWSCEEYAYEKYFKLSLFEDYVAQFGTDYRAMFDIAFGESDEYDAARSATVATQVGDEWVGEDLLASFSDQDVDWYPADSMLECRQLYGNMLFNRRADTAPDCEGPWVEGTGVKIPLVAPEISMGVDMASSYTFASLLKAYEDAYPGYKHLDIVLPDNPANDFLGLTVVKPESDTGEYDVLDGIGISDPALLADILAGKAADPNVEKDWTWHHQMSDELSPIYLDEELYLYDELKEELEELLDRRAETVESLEDTFVFEADRRPDYFMKLGSSLIVPGVDQEAFEESITDPGGPVTRADSHPAKIVWNKFIKNMMGYVPTRDDAFVEGETAGAVAFGAAVLVEDPAPIQGNGKASAAKLNGQANRENRGWSSDWNSVKREFNCRKRDRQGNCVKPWQEEAPQFDENNYATVLTAMNAPLNPVQLRSIVGLMAQKFGLQATITDSRPPAPTDPNGNLLAADTGPTGEATAYVGEAPGPSDSVVTAPELWTTPVTRLISAQQRLRNKIELIDDLIEALLHRANDMGCFDVSDEPNPCDWSPKLFYKNMYRLTGADNLDAGKLRESAYAKCADVTEKGMAQGWTEEHDLFRPMRGDDTAMCGWNFDDLWNTFRRGDDFTLPQVQPGWGFYVYTESTDGIDLLIKDAEAACNLEQVKAVRKTEEMIDKGKNNADRQDNGGGHISLFFDYDFGYDVPGLDLLLRGEILTDNGSCDYLKNDLSAESSCAMWEAAEDTSCEVSWNKDLGDDVKASLSADFKAGVTMFNKDVVLLGIYGDASVEKGDGAGAGITMTVAGISFLGDMDSVPFKQEDGVNDEEEGNGKTAKENGGFDKEWELFEFKKNFMIGPVPVSVSAGASGGAGIEFAPDLQFKFPVLDEGIVDADPDDLKYQMILAAGLSIKPYTFFDVFAAAAVDIGVAALGVRIDMTLINLSFPFKVAYGVNGSLTLNVDDTLDIPGDDPRIGGQLGVRFGYRLINTLSANLNVLSGKFSLYAKVGVAGVSKTFTKTLASWDGYKKTWPLINYSVTPSDNEVVLSGSFNPPWGGSDPLFVNIKGGNENCLFP